MRRPLGWSMLVLILIGALTVHAQDDATKQVIKALEGEYSLVSVEVAGKAVPAKDLPGDRYFIRNGQIIAVDKQGKEDPLIITRVDTKQRPAQIDFEEPPVKEKDPKDKKDLKDKKGKPSYGIIGYEKGVLTLCVNDSGEPAKRPKEFKTKDENDIMLVLKKLESEKK